MTNVYVERLEKLRALMKKEKIDFYLVPTSDFHESEYVGDFFKCREWMSGFTGSDGTLVVSLTDALLWTDGRYFLQAEEQLKNTTISLMKMGEENVPTIMDYFTQVLTDYKVLGFDGRCLSSRFVTNLKSRVSKKVSFKSDVDLVGEIWKTRPSLPENPVKEIGVEYVGKSRKEKLAEVKEFLSKKKMDAFVLTSLDDIAWLLNLRGNDVLCNPVFLSFFLMLPKSSTLYVNPKIISKEIEESLKMDGISIKDYALIYEDVAQISGGINLLLDSVKVNYRILQSVNPTVKIFDSVNPTLLPKAMKNKVEVANETKAHIYDGVAVTKFIYWLKNNVASQKITEMSAADQLENYRKASPSYQGPSFEPIIAYKEHGAIVHYSSTKETNVTLLPKSFVLCDTGGQYLEGTTDITRTVALGELTAEEKYFYTLVLKGHLALLNARFPYGVRGMNLDVLARLPLWNIGMDYNHGTGHGVGYFLNVHEAPNGFRWRIVPERNDSCILEEGMITSDEPGVYLENKFGIRHENLMVCEEKEVVDTKKYYGFRALTMVPFDLEAIDITLLNEDEVRELNEYHEKVYETIHSYLTKEEETWLKMATHPLRK
jgi:Xaa-Pro aminopeptidase